MTNRFDLTTQQVIILYAYRWQIELFFKFVKRTLKGLHLFNHRENGVEIQFYLLMTLAVLLLKVKQESQELMLADEEKSKAEDKSEEKSMGREENASEWIKNIAKIFYVSWKISKNWLLLVKNSLAKLVDGELLTRLCKT